MTSQRGYICGIEGCACSGGASLSPWRGACGKAAAIQLSDPWSEGVGLERIHDAYSTRPPVAPRPDRMGFGALTVGVEARAASAGATRVIDACGSYDVAEVLKERVLDLMRENVRLERRIERALKLLNGRFVVTKPQPRDGWEEVLQAMHAAQAILRGERE